MADVQLEHGYTRIATELLEAILRAPLTHAQVRVLFGVIRLTYGWNKKSDWIGSEQLARVVGMKPSNVRRTLRELDALRVVLKRRNGAGRRRELMVNKDYETWEITPAFGPVPLRWGVDPPDQGDPFNGVPIGSPRSANPVRHDPTPGSPRADSSNTLTNTKRHKSEATPEPRRGSVQTGEF